MRRIRTIAVREYRAMVGTKAFLFTIACMPILMMGGTVAPALLKKLQTNEPRELLVVDQSERVLPALQILAETRNEKLSEPKEGAEGAFGDSSPYNITAHTPDEWNDAARFELSERVRKGEIYAFLEIPEDAADLGAEEPGEITFYSEDAALSHMRGWLKRSLTQIIQSNRLNEASVDAAVVVQALKPVDVEARGLLSKTETGEIAPAEETDELSSLFVPLGIMMLMFLIIFLAAQPMLEAVLEEKSERIAEVLLGSVSSRQLLTGKLLGNVAGSLTVFVLYAGGAYGLAVYNGWTDKIPFHIVPWFVIYQILGVLFFSSIFMAIGSAVKQLKEAQSLLLPVWMLMFLPMFVWFNVLQDPNSLLASVLSFFPPSAPLMMMLRLSTGAEIPILHIVGSIVAMLAATFVVVAAAARIFQVGILWQGKTPKIGEVLRWLFRNPLVGS